MAIEIEKKGRYANMSNKEFDHEIKKELLRQKLGITREEMDDKIREIKHYFELNKKEIIRESSAGIKNKEKKR